MLGDIRFSCRWKGGSRRSVPCICNLEIIMRKTLAVVATGLALLLCQLTPSLAQPADAVIEFSGGQVAAGVGFTWGSGTLIYQGHRYPLKVAGLTLASVGITEYTAAGSVTGLKSPQDINGTYTSVAGGITLGGGGTLAVMKNQVGVAINLTATSAGLNLTLAAGGMKITME
jgi:hypothetical protein